MNALVLDDRHRTFFGLPIALGYFRFTEAWERFSYYGMTAILVFYMCQVLLLPGYVELIAGFSAFRAGLESVFGPMTTLAIASQIMGLHAGLVYLTPVFGGWIADRYIDRRVAMMPGAVMMSAGQLAVAFDTSLLMALLLLIAGWTAERQHFHPGRRTLCRERRRRSNSCVDDLFHRHQRRCRRGRTGDRNAGATVALTRGFRDCRCADACGPVHLHRRHALPACGTATQRRLSPKIIIGSSTAANPCRTRGRFGDHGVSKHAYYPNININPIRIDRSVNLNLLGFHVPVAWFNSIDSLISIVVVPPLFALWRWQASRHNEPDELGKIAIGAWIATPTNLLPVIACMVSPSTNTIVPIAYDVLLGIGLIY